MIGPTRKYPRGMLDETDEGELHLALTVDRSNGIIRLDFGTDLSWIGLPKAQAETLANALLAACKRLP